MNCFIAKDPSRCIGCGTCQAACIDGHREAGMQSISRLMLVSSHDITVTVACHHCEDAPCVKVCPVNVITKQGKGICIDEQRCIACKMCSIACPFGAIQPYGTPVSGVAGTEYKVATSSKADSPILNWRVGVVPCAVKCDLCESTGKSPQCVEACLTKALSIVDRDDLQEVSSEKRKNNISLSYGNSAMSDIERGY